MTVVRVMVTVMLRCSDFFLASLFPAICLFIFILDLNKSSLFLEDAPRTALSLFPRVLLVQS